MLAPRKTPQAIEEQKTDPSISYPPTERASNLHDLARAKVSALFAVALASAFSFGIGYYTRGEIARGDREQDEKFVKNEADAIGDRLYKKMDEIRVKYERDPSSLTENDDRELQVLLHEIMALASQHEEMFGREIGQNAITLQQARDKLTIMREQVQRVLKQKASVPAHHDGKQKSKPNHAVPVHAKNGPIASL